MARLLAPPGGLILHVDVNGDDKNDGLTLATALRTIQAAVGVAYYDYDHSGAMPSILPTAGQVFNEAVNIGGQPLGTNLIRIAGYGGQFVINSSTWCFNVADNANVMFENIDARGNTSHQQDSGIFLLHNCAVGDFGAGITARGDDASTNAVFSDGPAVFTLSDGIRVDGRLGAVIKQNRGGAGTASGIIGPVSGTTPFVDRLFHSKNFADLNLGATMLGGYASLGVSIADASIIHQNGLSIPGGTSVVNGGRFA